MAAQASGEELSQIIDRHMGTMCFQLFRVVLPGHTDHEPKSTLRACSDTRDGVLDHHGTLRHYPKHLCSLQKGIGCRLTGKALLDQHITIDTRIEEVLDFCRMQNRLVEHL